MKKRVGAWLICLALLLGCLPVSLATSADGDVGQTVTIQPIEDLAGRDDFIRGVDVSSLYIVAEKGGRFTDVDGSRLDDDEITNCLKILQKHGVNWIRLRLWVDPSDDNSAGGLNSLKVDLEIARRAKALGLKILLNFHYSDTWADPGSQKIPRSWVDVSDAYWEELQKMDTEQYNAEMWRLLTVEELADKVYAYTDSTMKAFAEAGCQPDMVQVGNETNGGMLSPIGIGVDNFAVLAKAGLKAVEDNDPQNTIRTMIHLANGGDNGLYQHMIGGLVERGVDFDIIGLSYYPFWHGPVEDFMANMNDISARYDKDVLCAETSYAYTLNGYYGYSGGTNTSNIFNAEHAESAGFPATLQGQADALRQTFAAVAQVPDDRGLGAFYWEPAWIPTPEIGAGWAAGTSWASWANQAVFSYEGQALPTIDIFNRILGATGEGRREAENAALSDGGAVAWDETYSNGGYVNGMMAEKDIPSAADIAPDWSNVPYVRYTVHVAKEGSYTLDVAYSAVAENTVYVRVGDSAAADWQALSLPGGEAWNDVVVASCTVWLEAGRNEIWVSGCTRLGEDHWVNYDYIEITTATDPTPVWTAGDVNNDGFINSTDARMVLQYTVALLPLEGTALQAADVDQNGQINSGDARAILQMTVAANGR